MDNFDLLLLDFGGVCTPSHEEYLTAPSPESTSLSHVRDACIRVVLQARTEGLVVAVLSNEVDMSWPHSRAFLQSVDHVFACSDNRIFKPDRRAYERALLITGIGAAKTLFVDDEPDNIAGAIGVGLAAVLFDLADPEASWREIAGLLGLAQQ